MTRWLALLALAGCYRPGDFSATSCAIRCDDSGACPDGRACSAGYCLAAGQDACDPTAMPPDTAPPGDAKVTDAPHDAHVGPDACVEPTPPPLTASCAPAASYTGATPLVLGATAYTVIAGVAADRASSDGHIDYAGAQIFAAGANLARPQLAAGGGELLMRHAGSEPPVASKHSCAGWSVPVGIVTHGLNGSLDPGAISATSPRRFVGGNGVSFIELSEGGDGSWTVERTFTPTLASGAVTSFRDPSLSADGLRLVFVGSESTTYAIYAAARASVSAGFGNAHVIASVSSTAHDPFLPSDVCTKIYFDDGTDTYVAHD